MGFEKGWETKGLTKKAKRVRLSPKSLSETE